MLGSRNQRPEAEMAPFTITPMTHGMLYACPCNFGVCRFGSSDCPRGAPLPGVTASVPLNYKLRLLPGHCGLTVPRDSGQAGESSYLQEQVALTSRKMQICFYTMVARKNACGTQRLRTECLRPSPHPRFICWSSNFH